MLEAAINSASLIPQLIKRAILSVVGQPNFLRRLQWPSIVRMLHISNGQTIVDLGAGPMYYSIKLTGIARLQVIAIDIDLKDDRVVEAQSSGVLPVCASGFFLPLADQSVDRILMSSLLHMVPEPSRLLQECRRILCRDGQLILSVPNEYRFIPMLMNSWAWPVLQRLLSLPETYADLLTSLNEKFAVGGPRGYYQLPTLVSLLNDNGFRVQEHEYSPRWMGSLLWELAVLLYARAGNYAFHLLLLAFPLARLCDKFSSPSFAGSEHIVRAVIRHDDR